MEPPLLTRSGTRVTAAVLLVGAVLSCRGEPDESLEAIVARCAKLNGARNSTNPALRDGLQRVERLGQTPLGLSGPVMAAGGDQRTDDAGRLLAASLNDLTRLKLLPRLSRLAPRGRLQHTPEQIAEARDLLEGVPMLRQRIVRAAQAPACTFAVDHAAGFFAKLRFLDDVAVAARLHLLTAATRLADGELPAALDETDAAMRWVDRLATAARVEARLLAATLRGECLAVLEAVAGGELVGPAAAQRADLERMYGLLRRSLDAWPDGATPLIGDRAVTLHAYEALREGLMRQIVTDDEQAMLRRRGLLARMESADASLLDADQAEYLRVMERLIDLAPQPLHASQAEIDGLLEPLAPEGDAARRAPYAAYLFLPGLRHALREAARDRAACEAWAIALAAVSGVDPPPYRINPATGRPYELVRQEGFIRVEAGDGTLRDPYARTVE